MFNNYVKELLFKKESEKYKQAFSRMELEEQDLTRRKDYLTKKEKEIEEREETLALNEAIHVINDGNHLFTLHSVERESDSQFRISLYNKKTNETIQLSIKRRDEEKTLSFYDRLKECQTIHEIRQMEQV